MKEIILFESGSYCDDDCFLEEDTLNSVMESIKAIFEPSVFIGTVGRWNGTFSGYRYCHSFSDLQSAISGYDLIISQTGARLHFTLLHHDGKHVMELRRLSDYGYDKRHNVNFDYFNEATVKFITRNTRNFGRISACGES